MKSNNKIVTVTASEQLILLVSKINATARDMAKIDACLLQITDWDAFAVLVIKRGVAGFVVKKLPLLKNKNRIPNEVFSLIE